MGYSAKIALQTHVRRRQCMMQHVGVDALVIVPAAPERVRSRDSLYPYRQDSDLWYLTGFPEPDAVLVLAPGRSQGQALLFCRPRDPARETWDGPRVGPEGAVAAWGMDGAWPIGELPGILPSLLDGRRQVYCSEPCHPLLQRLLADRMPELGAESSGSICDPTPLLHEMRLFKDAEELALMRHAAAISVKAHAAAMRAARPGMHEYQLQAEIEYVFARNAAVPSYASIVGAGANACVLHYHANTSVIGDGDLVLIDAGCEYHGYTADITRTFPANGRFSPEQRALHDLVCRAHAAALAQARPGVAWEAMHATAVEVLADGLFRLGLLQGGMQQQLDSGGYRRFYPHKTGHWLGLDVHDVGGYEIDGRSRPLQPGMVFTIEPGLYIPPGLQDVDRKWWGIGIRIEDDVLITEDGHDLLTTGLARSADEVEAWMAAA